jgi:hypothetical protein
MDYKTPDEVLDVTFDYSDSLGEGESIVSAVVTAHVKRGTDSTPQNTLLGSAAVANPFVYQRVQGGLHKVTYVYKCLAQMSTGRILELNGFLPVRSVV